MLKSVIKKSVVLFFLTFATVVFAQTKTLPNSIQLENNTSIDKEQFYLQSIYAADMEAYRLKNKDVKVEFSNGFECVLFSAEKLAKQGIIVDVNSYQENFDERFRLPLFSVCEDGQLTALYPKVFK